MSRSLKKGPFVEEKLFSRIEAMNQKNEKKVLKTERRDILILNDSKDDKVKYSGRNLTGVKIINLENVNLADVLNFRYLLITEKGLETFTKRYNK